MNEFYSNARAKAQESNLLSRSVFERICNATTQNEGLRILSEANFGSGESDYNSMCEKETDKLTAFIREVAPSENVKKYLLLPFDFFNAEAIMRAKYLRISPDETLSSDGVYDKSTMKEKIINDDYSAFEKELADALGSCDEAFTTNKATGKSVSSIFKRALFKAQTRLAKTEKTLYETVIKKIDCANVSVALRIRDYGKAKAFFIEGGTLSDEDKRKLCEEPIESLGEKASTFDCSEFVKTALQDMANGGSLFSFEKKTDEIESEYFEKIKYSTEGCVPFLRYCIAKERDIANVRIAMSALSQNRDGEETKRRLRFYER